MIIKTVSKRQTVEVWGNNSIHISLPSNFNWKHVIGTTFLVPTTQYNK